MIEISAQKDSRRGSRKSVRPSFRWSKRRNWPATKSKSAICCCCRCRPKNSDASRRRPPSRFSCKKCAKPIREKVYDEYIDRKGELDKRHGQTLRARRYDYRSRQQSRSDSAADASKSRSEIWNQGERIRVVIADVTKDQKGQQIKVSRASAELSETIV